MSKRQFLLFITDVMVEREPLMIAVPSFVPVPEKATEGSLGVDLYTAESVRIPANTTVLVKLHGKVKGACLLFARSSIWKMGVVIANGVGVIDEDYRGQLCIPLTNFGTSAVNIDEMTRVAQIVPICDGFKEASVIIHNDEEYENWAEKYPTERGEGGFGSTGVGKIDAQFNVGVDTPVNETTESDAEEAEANMEEAENNAEEVKDNTEETKSDVEENPEVETPLEDSEKEDAKD